MTALMTALMATLKPAMVKVVILLKKIVLMKWRSLRTTIMIKWKPNVTTLVVYVAVFIVCTAVCSSKLLFHVFYRCLIIFTATTTPSGLDPVLNGISKWLIKCLRQWYGSQANLKRKAGKRRLKPMNRINNHPGKRRTEKPLNSSKQNIWTASYSTRTKKRLFFVSRLINPIQ